METDKTGTKRSTCSTYAERGVSTDVPPAWEAFDKTCLRFEAYFQESVHESNDENYRIRKCKILFYPMDDTLQINESKTDNSGMPQGVLVARSKVPKAGNPLATSIVAEVQHEDEYFTVHDFNVGDEVTIYGRTFKITNCDAFTNKFLTDLGIQVGEPSEFPTNPYEAKLKAGRAKMECPGRPYETIDTLKQFIDFDRKVLRFYVMWDDTSSMFGDKRFMVLHYYLSNDTIELCEILPANSGRTGNGKFFTRGKLPKSSEGLVKLPGKITDRTVLNVQGKEISGRSSRVLLDSLRTGADDTQFYTDADLQVGATIEVVGRQMLVCDCDDFTRDFYKTKYGVDLSPAINVEDPPAQPPAPIVPPPTGYGTEEDSLVSVQRLVLQQPKKMAGAYLPKDAAPYDGGYILRFAAKLTGNADLNADRPFIISYYVDDDTIGVFEKPVKNSGIIPGKFLQRGRYYSPSGERITLKDIKIGERITIHSNEYLIEDADEFAKNYMADLGL